MIRTSSLFRAPTVQSFLHAMGEELAYHRSVLALLPNGVALSEVRPALRESLRYYDLFPSEVEVEKVSPFRPAAAIVAEGLRLKWSPPNSPRTVYNLARCETLPNLIVLEGLEHLAPVDRQPWIEFIRQWSGIAHGLADEGATVPPLCVIVPAPALLDCLPSSDVRLALHYWWGFPSILELHVLCREGHSATSWESLTRWREHLLPSLAGFDLALACHLWDTFHCLTAADLENSLCEYGRGRGWSHEMLEEGGAHEVAAPSRQKEAGSVPPEPLLRLWADGAVGWTLENGLELHSAALRTAWALQRSEAPHLAGAGELAATPG